MAEEKEKEKTRRPANTAFRQQRLWACQPILTPRVTITIFLLVALIMVPLGAVMLWANSLIREFEIEYTQCFSDAPDPSNPSDFEALNESQFDFSRFTNSPPIQPGDYPTWGRQTRNVTYHRGIPAADQNVRGGVPVMTTICTIQFTVPEDLDHSIYLYYKLENFNQNHRRYVKSLDQNQLAGNAVDGGTINGSNCDPLRSSSWTPEKPYSKPYYPCGLIANSIFNDTILSPRVVTQSNNNTGSADNFLMTNKGISWSSDGNIYKNTSYTPDQIAVPPFWEKRWGSDGYTVDNPPPALSEYEEFRNWMRTAGLPVFTKLALRNDVQTMKAGRYSIEIYDHFLVTAYGGKKSILVSTTNALGGYNRFLGIAFLVAGGAYLICGLLFLITYIIKPRKLGDHSRLSWNNESEGRSSGLAALRSAAQRRNR